MESRFRSGPEIINSLSSACVWALFGLHCIEACGTTSVALSHVSRVCVCVSRVTVSYQLCFYYCMCVFDFIDRIDIYFDAEDTTNTQYIFNVFFSHSLCAPAYRDLNLNSLLLYSIVDMYYYWPY